MVAKLPNKCFSLVVKIGEQEGREKRVTQNDFLDLYKKTEDEQYELLTDIFEGNTKFDDLKKQRVCVSPFFNTLRTNFVGINSTRIELVWNTSFIIVTTIFFRLVEGSKRPSCQEGGQRRVQRRKATQLCIRVFPAYLGHIYRQTTILRFRLNFSDFTIAVLVD